MARAVRDGLNILPYIPHSIFFPLKHRLEEAAQERERDRNIVNRLSERDRERVQVEEELKEKARFVANNFLKSFSNIPHSMSVLQV